MDKLMPDVPVPPTTKPGLLPVKIVDLPLREIFRDEYVMLQLGAKMNHLTRHPETMRPVGSPFMRRK
jgi:hypothetical protein